MSDLPARTELSDTIIYAILQTISIVNDHEVGCFRYNKLL